MTIKIEEEFRCEIYGSLIKVVLLDDIETDRPKYNSSHSKDEGPFNWEAQASSDGKGRILLMFNGHSSVNVNSVSHEVFHATAMIMRWCGVVYGDYHHESFSHLMGYLMEHTWRILHPKRIVKKSKK